MALAYFGRRTQSIPGSRSWLSRIVNPFVLYIDEFHSFTTDAFAEMLSELRKYALGLILAHQHTTQLDDATREAIFGNVGTIVAFRVGAKDADILAKQFGADIPRPRDLVGLANYEMFVKLMVDGTQSKPFSAVALPPSLAAWSPMIAKSATRKRLVSPLWLAK